jgi:enolase
VIEDILSRKVLNGRGKETIEVDVITGLGFGRASAPAGMSRGKAEVNYYPKGGVDQAIVQVEEIIAPELVGLNVDFQEQIDRALHELDKTKVFSVLGGNTAFAISLACAEAAANSYGLFLFQYLGGYQAHQLPYPLSNIISGGSHAKGKKPDIQEFLVLPYGAESFLDAALANTEIHKRVGDSLINKNKLFSGSISWEGAWVANISNQIALDILSETCEEVSNELGFEIGLGVDIAASSLWDYSNKKYVYANESKRLDSGEQFEYVKNIIKKYNLIYVEDPFQEEDYASFSHLLRNVNGCLICGDDLYVTNVERLSRGIKMGSTNALIVKVNQVGTLTDAFETVEMAKAAGIVPVVSHRSGETCDSHIAHLAVGFNSPIIKTGVIEGTRIAKINELIRIEEFLEDRVKMAELYFLRR